MSGLRIGSLCSGGGGLDLAVEQVFSARTVWHAETDTAASKVLEARWPDIPNHGDITEIDWGAVEPIDLATAGYPCQPFSAAGRRKGTDDERHLWPHVWEAIRRLRPRYTILENVAGHRSLGFDRVLGDLAESGLHVRWVSVRASDVGSCHQRERLWILVADPASDGRPRLNGGTGRTAACSGRERLATGSARRAPAAIDLLPTPTTQDGSNCAGPSQFDRNSLPLNVVATLLPTHASDTRHRSSTLPCFTVRRSGVSTGPRSAAGKPSRAQLPPRPSPTQRATHASTPPSLNG